MRPWRLRQVLDRRVLVLPRRQGSRFAPDTDGADPVSAQAINIENRLTMVATVRSLIAGRVIA